MANGWTQPSTTRIRVFTRSVGARNFWMLNTHAPAASARTQIKISQARPDNPHRSRRVNSSQHFRRVASAEIVAIIKLRFVGTPGECLGNASESLETVAHGRG